jgi:uncharacterized protein with NAD-binding domain and iron-sulfur cluster
LSEKPTKVAILGGGPAGLTAALELTATPELREKYEVTVHQLGWRLGGKGASGRNSAMCDRIEEHGLHVWFGCYDNAFSMIQRCYEERGAAAGSPLARWTDAFKPTGESIIYERFRERWVPHTVKLPPTPFDPGDRGEHTPLQVLQAAIAAVEGEWLNLAPELGILLAREAGRRLLAASRDAERLHAGDARQQALRARRLSRFAGAIGVLRDRIYRHIVEPRIENDTLRYAFTILDLVATLARGIINDDLLRRGWSVINDEELTAWLRRHGATEVTLECSPFLRAIYDGSFAYEEGDKSKPSMAAGKAAQDYLRGLFFYDGAFMWKMQAGMGDTVFAPMYEVLSRRGVRFEFFSAVTDLRLGPGGLAIDAIDVVKQVELTGASYEPMCTVNELSCWPSEPHWEQIKNGKALAKKAVNLEREINPLGRKPRRLKRGEDFELVVLAIPPDVQRTVCKELLSDKGNTVYGEMLENTHSVMTQAFQLWIDKSTQDLGWGYQSNSLMSCYVEPLDTYCNMDHLVPRECWPQQDSTLDIAYFCGVLAHDGNDTQEKADAAAWNGFTEYLERDVSDFWPGTARGSHFDWSVLVDPDGREGPERLKAQYFRANFPPTERYVLSLPGTIRYRLWPDQSGYENLILAGDWTRNGIDAGSIESAVTSGMLAAQAICGQPAEIAGLTGWLGADLEDPAGWRAGSGGDTQKTGPFFTRDPGTTPAGAPLQELQPPGPGD